MRACEYAGCGYRGDRAVMVRTPNGEWFCHAHAPLFDHGGRPTLVVVGGRQAREWRLTLHSPKGYDFYERFETPEALREFIERAIRIDEEDPAREVN